MQNWKQKIKENPEFVICALIFLLMIFFMVPVKISGDLSSGIYHFLYSKNALSNPEFFLNRWANPLFVLVSFPFAQFGIEGLHFFNAMCAFLTILLCCRIASKLGLHYVWLCPFLLLLTPVYFMLIPTALTETFFALALIYPIYLFISEKPASAAFFASFLPFAGIEGLWFLVPMLLGLVFIKKAKLIPNLFFGILFYSVLGFLFLGDFWWWLGEFKLSANNVSSFFYLAHLELMYGILVEVLLFAGIISLVVMSIRRMKVEEKKSFNDGRTKNAAEMILVLGTVVIFFVMRSASVSSGLFGTIGAGRELAAVSPLVALIALRGLNSVLQMFQKKVFLKKVTAPFAVACLVVMGVIMFTRNVFPPEISYQSKLNMQVADWIKKDHLEKRKIYFRQPYFILLLNLDPLSKNDSEEIDNAISVDSLKQGCIVIADNSEESKRKGFSSESLKNNLSFIQLKCFVSAQPDKASDICVFEKKENQQKNSNTSE